MSAGLVSPLMVIVVGATGIFSFLIPSQVEVITVLRYPILILASIFGVIGIVWSYIFIVIHLASLHSFGTPYMSPVMPLSIKGLKDFLIRAPWWMMKTRPEAIGYRDPERITPGSRPDLKRNKGGI